MVGPLLGGKRKATFFRRWILYWYACPAASSEINILLKDLLT